MRHLFAKVMTAIACCIILMHAVVPHHHHDSEASHGFVFEDEVTCECEDIVNPHDACCANDPHRHHSHHPFDVCKLQELLASLVITTKEDETYMALATIAEQDLFMPVLLFSLEDIFEREVQHLTMPPSVVPLPTQDGRMAVSLRAPPVC